jgi:hypothetical protein
MNIQDATKKAMEVGGVIYKPFEATNVIIIPTNTPDCCRGVSVPALQQGKPPVCRWQPQADDLISDNWNFAKAIDEVPLRNCNLSV